MPGTGTRAGLFRTIILTMIRLDAPPRRGVLFLASGTRRTKALRRSLLRYPDDTSNRAGPLHRLFAEDGHAPQHAPLAGGKIRARVQRAAVVPHQAVARAPDMLVDERRLLLVIKARLQDGVAFLPRQAFDLARHLAVDV